MKRSSLLIAILLFAPPVTGFGYVTGTTTVPAAPGEQAAFTAYLFGENGSIRLVKTAAPDDWRVSVTPEQVLLPVTDPDRVLQTETGYRNLRAVRTTVTPPPGAEPGAHPVVVTFVQHERDGTGTISVRQEHRFRFTVTVPSEEAAATPGVSSGEPTDETENATGAVGPDAPARPGGTDNTTARGGPDLSGARTRGLSPVAFGGIILFEVLWILALWRVLR